MLWLLAGAVLDALHDFRAMFYRSAGPGCILEPLQPQVYETTAPFAYRHFWKKLGSTPPPLSIGACGPRNLSKPDVVCYLSIVW